MVAVAEAACHSPYAADSSSRAAICSRFDSSSSVRAFCSSVVSPVEFLSSSRARSHRSTFSRAVDTREAYCSWARWALARAASRVETLLFCASYMEERAEPFAVRAAIVLAFPRKELSTAARLDLRVEFSALQAAIAFLYSASPSTASFVEIVLVAI